MVPSSCTCTVRTEQLLHSLEQEFLSHIETAPDVHVLIPRISQIPYNYQSVFYKTAISLLTSGLAPVYSADTPDMETEV